MIFRKDYRAALQEFLQINIKFCYSHFHQLMEKKRKSFLQEYTDKQEVRGPFKSVITFPVIDRGFINDVFEKIKKDAQDLPIEFFLVPN